MGYCCTATETPGAQILQATTHSIDIIRRAFDEACGELSIDPTTLTISQRDVLVTSVLARLKVIGMTAPNESDARWSMLPTAVRVS